MKTFIELRPSDSLDVTILKIYANENVIERFEIPVGKKNFYFLVTKEGNLIKVCKNGKKTECQMQNILED